MGASRYTLADVRRSYTPEKAREEWKSDWISALLYRPLSFFLAVPLLRMGISANAVTLASLAIGIALPLLAASGGAAALGWIGGLATLWAVLDCADGNIARVTASASPLGRYLDFGTDILFRVFLYSAIGLAADGGWAAGSHAAIAWALAASLLAIGARVSRIQYRVIAGGERPSAPKAAEWTDGGPGFLIFAFFSGLDRVLPLALLVAAAVPAILWPLLIWIVVYGAADFADTQIRLLKRFRR